MSNQVNSMGKGLTVKDLVTTGIFTALVFVFVLVGGIFFAPNPVLTFFMPAGSGLLAGPAAQDSIRARSSTAWLTYCSPWAVLDRISFSLLIPTAGRRPCWGTELSRAILTPCRQLPTLASWLPCLLQLLSLLQSVLL